MVGDKLQALSPVCVGTLLPPLESGLGGIHRLIELGVRARSALREGNLRSRVDDVEVTVLARHSGTIDEHSIVVHKNLPFARRRAKRLAAAAWFFQGE
jgi:hypothetical protein